MMKGGCWLLEVNVIFLFAILFEGAVGAPERNHNQAQSSGWPLRGKGRYQLGSTGQNCPPCNTKDETTPEPWSLDTGVVPTSIAGNGESRKDRDIWNDIANGGTTGDTIDNANAGGGNVNDGDNGGATIDNANAGGDDAGVSGGASSNDNNAGWGSNDGNTNDNGAGWGSNDGNTNENDAAWGSSNGGTSDSNRPDGGDEGSSNDGASNDSNGSSNTGSSSDNNNGGWGANDDNTGGFDSDNNNGDNGGVLEGNNDNGANQEQCTCVPILQCGASFRSADNDEYGESPCKNDGEVCCAILSTGLPSSSPPPPLTALRCGESRVYSNIDASSKTEQSSEFGEFPWTVLMYSRDKDEENNGRGDYRCAGSLIHPRLVLTAAHCVVKQRQEALVIRAGDWDLLLENRTEPLPSQESDVAQVAVHPLFRPGHPPHDVAIVLLTRPFSLADNVNTICVPPSDEDYDSSKCFSTGWGIDPSGATNNIMKKVQLPIVPRDGCQRALRSTRLGKYFKLDKSFKCAGGTKGKDLCIGDGGGPLSCQLKDSDAYVLVGLTSWGVGCGEEGIPGVFSDVVQANSWISDTKRNLVGDS